MLVATVKPSFRTPAFFPELENLLNTAANRSFGNVVKEFTSLQPAVNIKETENSFVIELAAPGLAKEDFKIVLEKNTLKASVKKENTKEVKEGEKTWRKEFSYHSFERSFTLADIADTENINASYENGVLQLVIPKKAEAKILAKQIAVA